MEVIKLGGDASGALDAINQTLRAMGAQNVAMDDLIKKSVALNKAGEESKAVVVAQASEFLKLQSILKNTAGVWEIETQKIIANTAALEKNAVAAAKAASAAQAKVITSTNRAQAETDVRAYFPVPSNATVSQLVSYETNLQRILKLVGSGKLTFDQFSDAFNKVKSGDKTGLTGFNEEQVKAYAALQKLSAAFVDTSSAAKKMGDEGAKAGLSLKNLFNIGEALLFKVALAGIVAELSTAVISAVKFQISISEIRTISQESQSTFQQWSNSLERVSSALGLNQADVAAAAYETLSNQTTKGAAATERFLMIAGEFARTTVSTTKDSVNLLTSAFNAYKLPVEDAERVSAIFFKTIDLGRIKATELANNFGRIAQPAAALGVSLEETTAALTVLTRQGVTPSDAMTQLLNVFIKLIKPTDQMKQLLAGWGTPTGEAAIATFGFAGVLKKLEEASHGSLTELSGLFNEIRGLRGASGLTSGGLFKDFESDLSKIKDAAKDYDLAKEIRAESAADTLVKEFTRVKNFFINDFGQSILASAASVNKALGEFKIPHFGSIEESLKTIITLVEKGVIAWTLYKGAALSVGAISVVAGVFNAVRSALVGKTVATVADTAATSANTAAIAANTAATGANVAAKASLIGVLGRAAPVIAVAAYAGYEIYENFIKAKEATKDYSDAVKQVEDQLSKTRFNKSENIASSAIATLKQNLGNSFKGVFSVLSSEIVRAGTDLEQLKSKMTDVTSSLGTSFKTWTDRIQQGIHQYSSEITKAKDAIKSSEKSMVNFGDTVDDILSKVQMKYATELQQIELTQSEINSKMNKAGGLFGTGKREDFEEAKKLINEVAGLEQQVFEKKVDRQKRLFTEGVQQNVRENGADSPFFGQKEVAFTVQTDPLKERLQNLKDVLGGWTQRFQDSQKQEILNNERIIEQEKLRKRTIEDLGKLRNDFDYRTKDGNVKPEFQVKGHPDQVDSQKVRQYTEDLEKKLRQQVKPSDNKLEGKDDPLTYFKDLMDQQTLLYKQALTERRKLELEDRQKRAQDQQKFIQSQGQEAETAKSRIPLELTQEGGTLDKLLNKFYTFASVIQENPNSGDIPRGRFTPAGGKNEQQYDAIKKNVSDQLIPQTTTFVNDLRQKIAAGTATKQDIDTATTKFQENLDKMSAAMIDMIQLNEKIQGKSISFDDAKDLANRRLLPGSDPKKQYQIGQTFGAADSDLKELQSKYQELQNAKSQADNIQKAAAGGDLTGFIQSTGAAKTSIETMSTLFSEGLGPATRTLIEGFQNLQKNLKAVQVPNIPQRQGLDNIFEGLDGYAEGGLVSGPEGHDSILAKLTKNEFVMPTGPTAKFLPQLMAMRKGISPNVYGIGSNVSTTVGDINITVQGQPSPDQTVRELGKKLRREVLRGNVTFSA